MGDFNLALVIIAVVICIMVFIFNICLPINYQHPDDVNPTYFPKFVVVLGLSIAAISILMLPDYVANRQACHNMIYNGACNLTVPMKDLWLAIHIANGIIIFFIIPLAMFYFEGDQDKISGLHSTMLMPLSFSSSFILLYFIVKATRIRLVGKISLSGTWEFFGDQPCIGTNACQALKSSFKYIGLEDGVFYIASGQART